MFYSERYELFTLATFVSETAGDRQHHLTVLALATLSGATKIGLIVSIGQGK
jgi:hypothetical protein